MKHSDVLLGLAAAAAGWRAGAQEAPKSTPIGFIVTGHSRDAGSMRPCERFGWIEGRNLNVECRVDREVRVPAARSRRRRR
jgi:hypothetical protein